MITLDRTETFFHQKDIHLLKIKFFSTLKANPKSKLFFELGCDDEFSRFNYPSHFFYEKIKCLLQINHQNYKENCLEYEDEKKKGPEMWVKLNTFNPCMVRISTTLQPFPDEHKKMATFALPFCNVYFLESNLTESKKSIFRIILEMKNDEKNTKYLLHQVFLLVFDFFNLKTI